MTSPNKDLGQHWLHDQDSLQAVLDIAAVDSADAVVEVGPGTGTLTKLLVEQAERVVAVEFDTELARQLPTAVQADNLVATNQDIRQFDFSQFDGEFKVVGNIPYYLTSHLVQLLLELPRPPAAVGLLVQKEVAQRLAAEPGDLSILGVTTQLLSEVELGPVVPAELFTPPPQVDSQIVGLRPKVSDKEVESIIRVVKAGFSQRRKQLRNSLAGALQLDKQQVAKALESCDISPKTRAQALTLTQWRQLATALAES